MSVKRPAYIEQSDIATKPSQMYVWDGAKPVRVPGDASGNLYTIDSTGMMIPRHDQQVVDESGAPATTTITYKLATITKATKTITVIGTTTTISMTYE